MSEEVEDECPECEPGLAAWMATFSDLMALLMCFFVLLLSFSELDALKFKRLAGSLRNAFGVQTEITAIIVCNTTASPVTFRIFHDNDGTTYDQTTALWYDVSLAANTTTLISSEAPNGGIALQQNGTIGVQIGTADAITFTFYGQTAELYRAR